MCSCPFVADAFQSLVFMALAFSGNARKHTQRALYRYWFAALTQTSHCLCCRMEFPRYCATGGWTLRSAVLKDFVGRTGTHDSVNPETYFITHVSLILLRHVFMSPPDNDPCLPYNPSVRHRGQYTS